MLPLSNPLGADVSFTAAVDRADVTVPATLVVPAGGRAELPIEWRPLLPKDGAATLTLRQGSGEGTLVVAAAGLLRFTLDNSQAMFVPITVACKVSLEPLVQLKRLEEYTLRTL